MRRLSRATSFWAAAILGIGILGSSIMLSIRAAQSLHLGEAASALFRACANRFEILTTLLWSWPSLALVVALTFGVIFLTSLIRQWFATNRFLRSLTVIRRDATITIVASEEPLCFTAGLLRPRIYLATSVESRLGVSELHAVLAHESVHVQRRDPLRNALLRACASTFFFVPIFHALERRYREEQEVHADAAALTQEGGARALASALYILSERPVPRVSVAPFASRGMLDIRIAFMDGQRYMPVPIALSKIVVSLVVTTLFVLFLIPSSHAETTNLIICSRGASTPVMPASHNPWIHQ